MDGIVLSLEILDAALECFFRQCAVGIPSGCLDACIMVIDGLEGLEGLLKFIAVEDMFFDFGTMHEGFSTDGAGNEESWEVLKGFWKIRIDVEKSFG